MDIAVTDRKRPRPGMYDKPVPLGQKPYNKAIGRNLTRLRESIGLSKARLANSLGVTACAVDNWEAGRNAPLPENLMALADIFFISLDDLMCRIEFTPPDILRAVKLREMAHFRVRYPAAPTVRAEQSDGAAHG